MTKLKPRSFFIQRGGEIIMNGPMFEALQNPSLFYLTAQVIMSIMIIGLCMYAGAVMLGVNEVLEGYVKEIKDAYKR
jgi:hypothetical protein